MNNIKKLTVEQELYDALLDLTDDDCRLWHFYNDCYRENDLWQATVELVYRCLKCNLITGFYPELNLKEEVGIDEKICTIEDLASYLAKHPLAEKTESINRKALNDKIWGWGAYYYGTELLSEIALKNNLRAHYDTWWEDEKEKEWMGFRADIEAIFAKNNLPWDLENPLFPIDRTVGWERWDGLTLL